MAQSLRICMLNTDVPVPTVQAHSPTHTTYGRIFQHLLCSAASKSILTPTITITSTEFDVTKGEYPPSLSPFDGIIISGSVNSAYDDLPWIRNLDAFIQNVYRKEKRVKIFGSCFGHQVICHALLNQYGVTVEKDPNGCELGVKEITLHQRFREAFGKGVAATMRLQFVHHDHVVIPSMDALPRSWMTLGSTRHCGVQGLYEAGRILTYQGHFEFDRFVNGETVKFFFPEWEPEVLAEALEAIDADDDSVAAAKMVLDFFLEKIGDASAGTHAVVGGLLTPPLQE
ncbi:class I glutamine amidotransferase-like protein [Clathrospora elynae]|uniref:Class I glutamine amidotransferase-like protein n=1 Tax=Clathrospora elynae TaxID=706981 RepID=A0A6A5SLJ6_9PLEO|nr:class I glutamine amidotransferase-like protein [Clathrospora elynae]